ncbi:MAG: PhzF family phenazine biosynthesis protein [Gemmatimonadales bacterium]
MPHTVVQADAFTNRPYAGNPAAVIVLPEPAEECWMQAVATELNLSETAFLLAEKDGYRLRWFTPRMEVDLCGHATLASAHVLWESGRLEAGAPARFYTRSGLLTATRRGDWIEMDFPAEPEEYCVAPLELTEALGVAMQYVGKNRFDYLIEVESEEVVRQLQPDIRLLEAIPARGFIVTSAAQTGGYDFVSRFFSPAAGIPEDPVTGSAHCCLGVFWSTRLGKDEMIAYQASPRGGVVRVRVADDRVILGGQAVTVLTGELV